MVIERLNWLAPLTVESAPRRLRVNLERVDGQLAVTLLGEDGDQVHCQARVITDVQSVAERLDLAHWRDRTWQRRLDGEAVYRLFDQMGLAYGASHRAIRQLLIAEQGGQREVLAQLNLEGIHPGGDWWLEPGMTDSVLQAAIGMLLPLNDSVAAPLSLVIPFALQRLEIIAPCQRRMWALLRSDLADNPAGRITIDLCDDQGQLCARFTGLSSRPLTAGPKTEANTAAIGADLVSGRWCDQRTGGSPGRDADLRRDPGS